MGDLKSCRLYGILDLGYVDAKDASRVADEMIAGGVDIIQLRAKDVNVARVSAIAREVQSRIAPAGVPLVINDHPQITREVGAAGVHLGQEDGSVAAARQLVGRYGFVGKSTHSLEQAKEAAADGADYIGFGPLFATPTKPDYAPIGLSDLEAVHAAVSLPIFCIGGIKLANLPEVIAAGARRVVIVSGLLHAADIAEYARSAKALLNNN